MMVPMPKLVTATLPVGELRWRKRAPAPPGIPAPDRPSDSEAEISHRPGHAPMQLLGIPEINLVDMVARRRTNQGTKDRDPVGRNPGGRARTPDPKGHQPYGAGRPPRRGHPPWRGAAGPAPDRPATEPGGDSRSQELPCKYVQTLTSFGMRC